MFKLFLNAVHEIPSMVNGGNRGSTLRAAQGTRTTRIGMALDKEETGERVLAIAEVLLNEGGMAENSTSSMNRGIECQNNGEDNNLRNQIARPTLYGCVDTITIGSLTGSGGREVSLWKIMQPVC